MHVNRVVLIVLDSVGIGNAPDANIYGDEGSNTLGNTARFVGGIHLPNLATLGLGNIGDFHGIPKIKSALGAYGRLTEESAGKDTTTGHWELSGILLSTPFPTFPNGFPLDFIRKFEVMIARKTIGNFPASGTEIIMELGKKHLATGSPIVYTSGDSVFQIAAHEEIIPIDELYSICEIARSMLVGNLEVGRVIARPFVGTPDNFVRTENRKDFSLQPPSKTILDVLVDEGYSVVGVGKIEDIFANRGLTESTHTGNNKDGVSAILSYLEKIEKGLIFANLNDFDSLYGHRNDPRGYARALVYFDFMLSDILNKLSKQDVLIITADHGNDPTTPSTDHSREQVPILITGDLIMQNTSLGIRNSFADVGATLAKIFRVNWDGAGSEFASIILRD